MDLGMEEKELFPETKSFGLLLLSLFGTRPSFSFLVPDSNLKSLSLPVGKLAATAFVEGLVGLFKV